MTESMFYKFENGESPKKIVTMRELTDEEILEVANQIEPLNGSTMEQAFIYFARAILKKAGEK
jgi:hypothetical protein